MVRLDSPAKGGFARKKQRLPEGSRFVYILPGNFLLSYEEQLNLETWSSLGQWLGLWCC